MEGLGVVHFAKATIAATATAKAPLPSTEAITYQTHHFEPKMSVALAAGATAFTFGET